MGQAIGMSVAACLEIAYWLTLKPLVFWLQSRKKRNVPSENATRSERRQRIRNMWEKVMQFF